MDDEWDDVPTKNIVKTNKYNAGASKPINVTNNDGWDDEPAPSNGRSQGKAHHMDDLLWPKKI